MSSSVLILLSLAVLGAPAPARGAATEYRPLDVGGAVEGEAKPGAASRHALRLGAGQYVRLTVAPPGNALGATLVDPSGKVLADVAIAGNDDSPLRISAIAEVSGRHELRISLARRELPATSYRVTVDTLRTATDDDHLRVRAARAYAEAVRLGMDDRPEHSKQVIEQLDAARDLWHRVGDPDEEADALMAKAGIWFDHGSSREALQAVQESLALYQAAGDRRNE